MSFVAVTATTAGLGTAYEAQATTVARWEQWQHIPGVFDVAGLRSDGRLVTAAHRTLSLLTADGRRSPYAPAYAAPDGSESYIALSPSTVAGSGCSFARDDVYALDLSSATPGVTRVSRSGAVSHFTTVDGVSTLTGIAFDTVGDFGHRLLVIGPSGTHTTVFAIDCTGTVTTIGTVATALEGGIAVAPRTFGAHAGQLIAANETDGTVYAVSASGALSPVAASAVPAGGDIGVESVGFVPPTGAAVAYMADRLTPGNPHPGTDSLLRVSAGALKQAGVVPGDALVGTEGGATVVDVRCSAHCSAHVVALGPPTAHGEGKLLVVGAAGAPPAAAETATAGVPATVWIVVGIAGALIVGVAAVTAVRRRT